MKALDQNTARFLRALIRPAVDIAEFAKRVTCWDDVVDGARSHGVLPMLYRWMDANGATVPPGAMKFARTEFERNVFHSMANAAELLQVLDAFGNAGIAAMPFKGVVLAATAYGDIKARNAGDLDVLVHYRDLPKATALLKTRGYELKTQTLEDGSPEAENYFEFHFERPEDGMVIELRWRLELTQPRYRRDIGMDWAWAHRRTARLAGADVPNLSAVSTLLVLCMHGSKHMWSRLMWICDVAKLLESEPELDWNLAKEEAKRVGLQRCLALGVLLARRVAHSDVPAEILRGFESDRSARELAQFFEEHVLEDPGRLPGGWMPYSLRILAPADQVAAVLSPAFLRPNARDRAVMKLPKALEPLYYVIRPVRMLLDRSGR